MLVTIVFLSWDFLGGPSQQWCLVIFVHNKIKVNRRYVTSDTPLQSWINAHKMQLILPTELLLAELLNSEGKTIGLQSLPLWCSLFYIHFFFFAQNEQCQIDQISD